MFVSDELWQKLILNHSEFSDWKTLFNKNGVDGSPLDEEDNTSFVNQEQNKGIKIMFEPESNFQFDSWISSFGDEQSGFIEILNVTFNDLTAYAEFEKAFLEWIRS